MYPTARTAGSPGGRAGREGARHPDVTMFTERRGHRQGRQLRRLRGVDTGGHGARAGNSGDHHASRPARIIIATGFEAYPVADDEFGYGLGRRGHACPTSSGWWTRSDGPLSTTASRSRTSSTSTAWAAGRRDEVEDAQRVLLPLLLHGRGARRPQVAAKPGKTTSTTCTATSAPTASTSCCTTSAQPGLRVTSRCPTTSRLTVRATRRPAACWSPPATC